MRKTKKKGQAATEFLVTYGWMLMIVALTGAGIAYMGVFESDKVLPEQCKMGFDISCEKYSLKNNGTANIKLKNRVGEPITAEDFVCSYPTDDNITATYDSNQWNPGEERDFVCSPPTGTINFAEGSRENIKLTLIYRKRGGSFSKSIEGELEANTGG